VTNFSKGKENETGRFTGGRLEIGTARKDVCHTLARRRKKRRKNVVASRGGQRQRERSDNS